jgi:hypothetical protein
MLELCRRCRLETVESIGILCLECSRQVREVVAWSAFWFDVFGLRQTHQPTFTHPGFSFYCTARDLGAGAKHERKRRKAVR